MQQYESRGITRGVGGTNGETGVSRRSFLRVAAGGAVVLPGLLAACTAPAPPASPTAAAGTAGAAGAAGAPGAAKPASVLPTFVPLQNGPKPDYVSAGQQYEDGWDLYPAKPVKSWTKAPPGAGTTISVFTNAYNPPSTPLEQNPAWQEVNKQLNANVQLEGITDIIASRRPLGDYDQIKKEWQDNGGEQIRRELAEALAAASK